MKTIFLVLKWYIYLCLDMYCFDYLLETSKFCEISQLSRKISLTPLLAPVVWRGRAPDADPVAGGVELDGGAVEGGRHIEGVSPGQRPTQQLPELLLEARQPATQPDKSKF